MVALLTPGSSGPGSWAQLSPIAQIGSGVAADRKPIARWVSVPCRSSQTRLRFGVVAFHYNGIEKVQFIANDGTPVDVTVMSIEDPEIDDGELAAPAYWVDVDLTGLPDGTEVEIRAVVYPLSAGTPRILQGAMSFRTGETKADIYASGLQTGEHSLNCFKDVKQTIYVDSTRPDDTGNGATPATAKKTITGAMGAITGQHVDIVILNEGDHAMRDGGTGTPIVTDGWVTIRSDEAIDPEKVFIVKEPGNTFAFIRAGLHRLGLRGVTVRFGVGVFTTIEPALSAGGKFLWLQKDFKMTFPRTNLTIAVGAQVLSVGNGGWNDLSNSALWGSMPSGVAIWATNCWATDTPHGFNNAILLRNTYLYKVSGDLYQNSLCIFNTRCVWCNTYTTAQHTDIWQMFMAAGGSFRGAQPHVNCVVFNNQCAEMYGVQTGNLDNVNGMDGYAVVNTLVENVQDITGFGDLPASSIGQTPDTNLTQWSCSRNWTEAGENQAESIGFVHNVIAHNDWFGRSWLWRDTTAGTDGGGTPAEPERPRPRDVLVRNNALERVYYSRTENGGAANDNSTFQDVGDEFVADTNIINLASALTPIDDVDNTVRGLANSAGGNYVRFTQNPTRHAWGTFDRFGPDAGLFAGAATVIPGLNGASDPFPADIGFMEPK